MSMTDPIADMLTRIRNGQKARKVSVSMPASKAKEAVAKVLQDEGYITGYATDGEGATKALTVELKYFDGVPGDREDPAREQPGPAGIPRQGRFAEGAGRTRCGHCLDVCGRDERSPGA